MVQLTEKSKARVNWKVSPYDYSPELKNEVRSAFARKYGIPKDNVKVIADFIKADSDAGVSVISNITNENIQDPDFQRKLYLEYLRVNEVKDYDIDIIDRIDKDINSRIDYKSYDKFRRFSIKWVKWSNFQSYGADNSFDFSSLDGLVLLNGEPANQSGKTTFAVDLLHFLLFGKSGKWEKLEELFNYTLPEETELYVEGCITVDGEDYVIKRTITRPPLKKRTAKTKVTHKVEYYRVIAGELEGLNDYVEENGEDSRQTNKAIKESIGREDDFDLMMCITGSNLDSLIDEKPTEKGRLFSRWIGLLPLEEKDVIAREIFNQTIKPSLLSNQYNRETLSEEIEAYTTEIKECQEKADSCDKTLKEIENEIAVIEGNRKALMESKRTIDSEVLKIDITTLRRKLEDKKNEGVASKSKMEMLKKEVEEIGEVDFSVEEYDRLVEHRSTILLEQNTLRSDAKNLMQMITQLKTSEYCPTCGRKLDNVDNTEKINESQASLDRIIVQGKKIAEEVKTIDEKIASMKETREKYGRVNTINVQIAALEVSIANLRSECRDLMAREKEYLKNSEAIDKNNELDISIRNAEAVIKSKMAARDFNVRTSTQCRSSIEEYKKNIDKRKEIIERINTEEKLVKNWKIYLDMVGKNGISKMVMRNALPIINARMSQILDDVCDFDVNVGINNRNEVTFNIVRDGVTKDLNSGSGFEKTASAIALRSVLADMSTISRMNFIVLDEILGRVASENYDKMKLLYERISKGYDFVFHITHINDVKDWHDHIVTVVKSSKGVSSLKHTAKKTKTTRNAH